MLSNVKAAEFVATDWGPIASTLVDHDRNGAEMLATAFGADGHIGIVHKNLSTEANVTPQVDVRPKAKRIKLQTPEEIAAATQRRKEKVL
jgi:IMP dehydrogenase/GMP reductase